MHYFIEIQQNLFVEFASQCSAYIPYSPTCVAQVFGDCSVETELLLSRIVIFQCKHRVTEREYSLYGFFFLLPSSAINDLKTMQQYSFKEAKNAGIIIQNCLEREPK